MCRLPENSSTIDNLIQLGSFMAGVDPTNPNDPEDSNTPAVFTYLGQFIDHDITARTDREGEFKIADGNGNKTNFTPIEPGHVALNLKNGRRPTLDLDSVFGDGPSLSGTYATQADDLYDTDLKLKINQRANYIDLPRNATSTVANQGNAIIGDGRNDENVMISQLHAAFIAFYNRIYDSLSKSSFKSKAARYTRARRLTEWAYQYMVLNDYLPQVCDSNIVKETLSNGPYYFGTYTNLYMPVEFSVAGFRFGHSMIRPSYRINGVTIEINKLLGVGDKAKGFLDLNNNFELKQSNVVKWSDFAKMSSNVNPQMARKINTKIAKGLLDLNNVSPMAAKMMEILTQRNLLRGYLLSLPTGQSMAKAMRIFPMTPAEIKTGNTTAENTFLDSSGFAMKTPLWYYILKEAEVHSNGECLGAVGSKLVAETLIGLVKKDQNSYLNNLNDKAVVKDGIKLRFRSQPIRTMADILDYAQVPQ